VSHKGKLAKPAPAHEWTRVDDYVSALARKRTFRRARRPRERSQPEAPRMMLSTLPFLALLVLLGVLSVAMMVLAFPGNQPAPRPRPVAAHEQGVAPRGWFQEAQRDFHR
jgi:hypothetical protein